MNPTRRAMLTTTATALVTARLQTAQAAFNAFGVAQQISQAPSITSPFLFLTAAPGTSHVASGSPTTGTNFSCPADSTVVVHINAQTSGSIASLVDLVGGVVANTYTKAGQAVDGTAHDCELWFCAHCLALPAGSSTFRATTVAGGTYTISGAAYFTGADTLDQTATTNLTGGGAGVTGYTLTTPTLTAANQIAFGANVDGTPSSYTEDLNWIPLLGNPASSVASVDFVYQIVNSTNPISWTVAYAPLATVDVVIATFKQGGGSGPGTGLSTATSFLPATLPQVPSGSDAAGGGWHLTARPWAALNVPASSYLARAKAEAAFWVTQLDGGGHVVDPYQHTNTEADRGKIPQAIGIIANAAAGDGGTTSLVTSGVTMMNGNVIWYQTQADPTFDPPFYLQPTFDGIPLYAPFIGSFGITSGTISGWYSSMNNFINNNALSNHLAYQDNGLWSAHQDIALHGASLSAFTNAVNMIEADWAVQLNGNTTNNWGYAGAIAPFDVYRDFSGGGAPNPDTMCVEVAGRGNYALMIAAGYNGPSVLQIDQLSTTGTLTSLLTQDPTGQNAAGGRQSNQNWIDAAQQSTLEVMAQKFRVSNPYLAGQFQHAAMLNFNNIARWPNPQFSGTFFPTKNHFNPALLIGAQASYQFMYNLDITQFTAISYAQRAKNPNIAEHPCPSEIGGYAFKLPTTLTYAFANAGGTHIQIALSGYTATDFSNNYWTVPGFQRIGRVNWETRLGPSDGGWLGNNAFSVSFGPTWNPGAGWTRLAQNHSATGTFSTTFVSPGLVLCRVIWTVPGGTFTQNITVTPDGVLVQTTQTGFSAGNWGMTFPILTSDGDTSGANTYAATATTTGLTQPIASAQWPGSLDSQNYMTVSANPTVFTAEASCQTAFGNVTPIRAVVAADTTLNVFVYPASNSADPNASSVQSSFAVTGPNTYTCNALGSSVVSSSATGTYYIGRTCASGWAQNFTLSGGAVTFSQPCFFIAQLSVGVVTAIEVDRNVTATIQAQAPQNLTAYTPVTITGSNLPTGLLASFPLGSAPVSGNQTPNQGGFAESNGDGTTGYNSGGTWTNLQVWFNFPASQFYQFVIPASCAAFNGVPANSLQIHIDQIMIPTSIGTTTNNNWFSQFVSNASPSQNYTYNCPVLAGWHSIQVVINTNAYHGPTGGPTNSRVHVDRLNIIGTGNALPAEPAGIRDPTFFPMSALHFINTPFGANATWQAVSSAQAKTINGTGGNGANISVSTATFSNNFWLGQPTDPVFAVSTLDNLHFPPPTVGLSYPVRGPAGLYASFGGDGGNSMIDTVNPRFTYTGFGGSSHAAGRSYSFVSVMTVQDSYNLNQASPQSALNGYGIIRVADLDNGVVAHRIVGGLATANAPSTTIGYGPGTQTSDKSGLPWPGCESDFDWPTRYANSNGPPYASVIGIPPQIARPGGMNTATAMMWDCFQNYGCFLNVSAGTQGSPSITIYAEGTTANHPVLNAVSWGTIVPNLSIMSNPAPIVVGQGFGGGNPRVPLLAGVKQGYPSLGLAPYTPPASPVGIPIQLAADNPNVLGSGVTSTAKATTSIPIGSFVLVFLHWDRISASQLVSPMLDSAGNSYTAIQPTGNSSINPTIMAYCLSTTNPITTSTGWIPIVTPAGSANYLFLGAYYRPQPPSGSPSLRVSNSVTSGSNVTTLSTSLAGVQTGDLIIGLCNTVNYAEITNPAGYGSLVNVPSFTAPNNVTGIGNIIFQVAASAGTKTVNPTWDNVSPASLTAAAFANTNIAT